jgi:hypothetical protein
VLFLADVDVPLFRFEVEAAPLPPPPPPEMKQSPGSQPPASAVDGAPAGRRRLVPRWLPWAAAGAGVLAAALIWWWPDGASTSPDPPTPESDWVPGLQYNLGVVDGVTDIDGHPAITYDQVKLASGGGFLEGTGFSEEPVVAWWPEQRIENISSRERTFLLAPDVEVLRLDTDREAEACAAADGSVPPTWERIDDVTSGVHEYASLTFSDSGLVERIRFTHPCPG